MTASSALRLDQPSALPLPLREQLDALRPVFLETIFLDDLLERPSFRSLADDVEDFFAQGKVRGYHCTKELYAGQYLASGLRPLDAQRQVDEFLRYAEERLVPSRVNRFRERFTESLLNRQNLQCREGMIWFSFSPWLVKDHGTQDFFRYFGGEILYRAFAERDDPELHSFLRSIGAPVVVEVGVPANEVRTFRSWPCARDVLSHYGRQVNPEFLICSLEGYMTRQIEPDEVIAVHRRDEFWRTYWPNFDVTCAG